MWVDVDEQDRVSLPSQPHQQIGLVGETKPVIESVSIGQLVLGRVTLDAEFQSAQEFDDAFVYDMKR